MKWIILAVALLFVFGCTGAAVRENTVKIGYLSVLSGSTASSFEPSVVLAQLAVDEANAAGGINGKKIELLVDDTVYKPKNTLSILNKMMDIDGVDVFVVHGSVPAVSAIPVINERKKIMIAGISSNPIIAKASDYVFRLTPNSEKQSKLMAEHLKGKKVGLIYESNSYTQPIKENFVKYFEGELVAIEEIDVESQDYRTQISKVKSKEPEVLVLLGLFRGALLIKQTREIFPEAVIVGNEFLGSETIFDLVGVLAEGITVVVADFDPGAETQRVFDYYMDKTGKDRVPFAMYTSETYDAMRLLIDALKHGNDVEEIRKYLSSVKRFEGIVGTFGFDEDGDSTRGFEIKTVTNGTLV
jgi:branched-chain amino acid transport system substrate-binding protein